MEPQEVKWDTLYGLVLVRRVPHVVHDIMIRMHIHHLEDILDRTGVVKIPCLKGPAQQRGPFAKWVRRYQRQLTWYRNQLGPEWAVGPDAWPPKITWVASQAVSRWVVVREEGQNETCGVEGLAS